MDGPAPFYTSKHLASEVRLLAIGAKCLPLGLEGGAGAVLKKTQVYTFLAFFSLTVTQS